MYSVRSTRAEEIGLALARLVRGDAAVRELYARQHYDVVELWLVTAPVDPGEELRFYEAGAELDREFEGIPIDFAVINPSVYEPFDLESIIPVHDPGVTLLYQSQA